ncbi:MAG: hypothetical protein KHZ05_10625 [Oscillospiraceae bacterium]|nr:hypothetical protein [Oscillospiraceae bacterium]
MEKEKIDRLALIEQLRPFAGKQSSHISIRPTLVRSAVQALEEAEREVRCLRWAIRRLTKKREPRPESESPPAWAVQILSRFERVE